ncbi:chorismate mutase [Micromonospora rubida]
MMADVVEQSGSVAKSRPGNEHEAGGPAGDGRTEPASTAGGTPRTGTDDSAAAARIVGIRERIDEIDRTVIELWQERAALSQEVGATRMASGGTRLVLSREREILERFRQALGADGTQLALLLLRAGRGPL